LSGAIIAPDTRTRQQESKMNLREWEESLDAEGEPASVSEVIAIASFISATVILMVAFTVAAIMLW
jgi:hypothetical protein